MIKLYKSFTSPAGLKLLISLLCFGATFYQSYVLYDNYKAKDTLRKNSEIFYPGDYITPMIIVCSDPGNTNSEEPLIETERITGIPRIKSFKTIYKVNFPPYNFKFLLLTPLSRVYVTLLVVLQCLQTNLMDLLWLNLTQQNH